jgi:hypothetical protein
MTSDMLAHLARLPRLEIRLSWFNWEHLAINVYRLVAPELLRRVK